eukprot:764816-Hanusia_phi.AAC.3
MASSKTEFVESFERFLEIDMSLWKQVKQEKPIIAYGNASFAWTGSGEKAVNVNRIKRECQKRYQTFDVGEFRTTMCCRRCGGRLSNIRRRQISMAASGLGWGFRDSWRRDSWRPAGWDGVFVIEPASLAALDLTHPGLLLERQTNLHVSVQDECTLIFINPFIIPFSGNQNIQEWFHVCVCGLVMNSRNVTETKSRSYVLKAKALHFSKADIAR